MHTVADALTEILAEFPRLGAERVGLKEAAGRERDKSDIQALRRIQEINGA